MRGKTAALLVNLALWALIIWAISLAIGYGMDGETARQDSQIPRVSETRGNTR